MSLDTVTAKVTATHLRRHAYLYIRQSSLAQVMHNTESTMRQYDLRTRAITLGWPPEKVIVIDSDQGLSGASADREGFQRLVAEVGMGRAGIVLGLEVSRLARNNADWHRLLEICAFTSTLICDEDGLYDPTDFNDRMLLGMKGQLSEAELHLLRSRLRGGILSKARRGELALRLPVGFVYDEAKHVLLDPDAAVQAAIGHLFASFTATGSARGVVAEFNHAGLRFPTRIHTGPGAGQLAWAPLTHTRALHVLHNPRYAGVYYYGRRRRRLLPEGGINYLEQPRDQWTVFLPNAHPGYLTLEQFEANQIRLATNAAARGSDRAGGPVREGPALLQGIVICGRCGRRMTVRYHTRRGLVTPDYVCQRAGIETATPACQVIAGYPVDQALADLVLQVLTPLALQTCLSVADELVRRASQADHLRELAVARAEYRAGLARRRYLAVDPDNRLVAQTLEADWNTALREVADARAQADKSRAEAPVLSETERAKILALAADIPALWANPATPQRERKRLIRLLVTDVTLLKTGKQITVSVRMSGGKGHTLTLTDWEAHRVPKAVIDLIDELLAEHTLREIVTILNQRGLRSATGTAFTMSMLVRIRDDHQLRSRWQRLRERGLLTRNEIAAQLGVRPGTITNWLNAGLLSAERYDGRNTHLYYPPGPNPPQPRRGIARADHLLPQSTSGPERGAV